MAGTDNATFMREAPGMSAFAYQDGVIYHTYSAYARGLDSLWGMYQWLDRAPLGRNVEVAEVGSTGVFLASDASSGITGEVIYVDCGYNIMGF